MMRRLTRVTGATVALALICGLILSPILRPSRDYANAGPSADTATIQALRRSIEQTRLQAQYAPVEAKDAQVLAGTVLAGGTEIGFEFQVFRDADEANVRSLGRLGARDLGFARPQAIDEVEVSIRGVLGNVAYATYRPVLRHETRSVNVYLANEKARLGAQRALDDALFGLFPANDPEAQPIRRRP